MPPGRVHAPARGHLGGAPRVAPALALALTARLAVAAEPLEPAADATSEPASVRVRGARPGGFESRATEGDTPREVTDVASLLAPLPGVHVRRFGGDDSLATLSVRGSSSSQVAIVLGGVPLSGGSDPTLDLGSLPLWPGVQMRVYRSFAPAALGPGSLGGTLELRAPPVSGPPRTEVWSAVGSFGALRLRVGDSRTLGDGPDAPRVTAALSANRTDGDFTYVDALSLASSTRAERTRTNAGVAAANGLVQWSLPFRLSPTAARTARLTVLTLLQARRQGLAGTIKAPTTTEALTSTRALASVELAAPASAGSTLFARGWGRHNHLALRSRPDEAQLSGTPLSTSDTIVALGGSAGLRGRPTRGVSAEARLDGAGERFSPGTWVGALAPGSATRASAGLGADVEGRPAERLTLTASGRADLWHDAAAEGAGEDAARGTGHLGAQAELGALTLAAHGGHLARAPGFVERYGNRGAFLGSPGLRPEAATTLDLGASLGGRFRDLTTSLEVVGFSTWATDLIVFVPQGFYGRAKATNIGRARVLGGEVDARLEYDRLLLRASYTWLRTANDSACDVTAPSTAMGCAAPPLPGRPGHDLVLDVGLRVGAVRLRYGLDVVADLAADLTGAVRVPPRALQSVGARLLVGDATGRPGLDGLTLALDVSNLADLRTASYAGVLGPVEEPIGDLYEYPLPGRAFLLSARFTAGAGRERAIRVRSSPGPARPAPRAPGLGGSSRDPHVALASDAP